MATPTRQTGCLHGIKPEIFTGDRKKVDVWKQQFQTYWVLNDNHEVMATPYYRAVLALSLIRGPLVNDWVSDQIDILWNRLTRTVNPVIRDEDEHWNEFISTFDAAFSDSTKAQQAHVVLQQLTIRGNDLNSYYMPLCSNIWPKSQDMTWLTLEQYTCSQWVSRKD